MNLTTADYLIIVFYFIFVIGVGILIKKKIKSSSDFLSSSKGIPLWITSLAFISANLGAQEVIGMVASGAKYGRVGIEYWEHQGEASVDFFGNKLSCKPVR